MTSLASQYVRRIMGIDLGTEDPVELMLGGTPQQPRPAGMVAQTTATPGYTPPPDWRETARKDPQIQEWWEELRRDEGMPADTDIVDHMEASARSPSGYNYPDAIASGVRPDFRDPKDHRLHWGGRNPKTGEILKGRKHPTWGLSAFEDIQPGSSSTAPPTLESQRLGMAQPTGTFGEMSKEALGTLGRGALRVTPSVLGGGLKAREALGVAWPFLAAANPALMAPLSMLGAMPTTTRSLLGGEIPDPEAAGTELLFAATPAAGAKASADELAEAGRLGIPMRKGGQLLGAPPSHSSLSDFEAQARKIAGQVSEMTDENDFLWYDRAGQWMREHTRTPVERDRFARSLALLSSNAPVDMNWNSAVRTAGKLARGEPIEAGTENVGMKYLENALATDAKGNLVPFAGMKGAGLKVQNFYRNILDAAEGVPGDVRSATIDRHMYRIGGWKDDPSVTANQYAYQVAMTRRVKELLGRPADEPLRNTQAAAWAAQIRQTPTRSGPAPGAGAPVGGFDVEAAKSRTLIPWETIPTTNTAAGRWLYAQPVETQRKYTEALARVTLRDDGVDEIAEQLGVPLYRTGRGSGGYEGGVHPGYATSILAEPKRGGGYNTEIADRYALMQKYIYNQKASPWFRADPSAAGAEGVTKGIHLKFAGDLDDDVEQSMLEELAKEVHPDASFSRVAPGEYAIVNFTGLPEEEFLARARSFAADREGLESVGYFGAPDSNYFGENWSAEQIEERLAALEAAAPGSPSVLPWIRDRRARAEAATHDFLRAHAGEDAEALIRGFDPGQMPAESPLLSALDRLAGGQP